MKYDKEELQSFLNLVVTIKSYSLEGAGSKVPNFRRFSNFLSRPAIHIHFTNNIKNNKI